MEKQVLAPFPGDGVCPTVTQFRDTCEASERYWRSLIVQREASFDITNHVDKFLALVDKIPPFQAPVSGGTFVSNDQLPQIKYSCEWVTTTNPSCDQPVKRMYECADVARQKIGHFKHTTISKGSSYCFKSASANGQYFSHLIFGWAYVLSARWTEVLQDMGEEAFMRQKSAISKENFWDIISGQQWRACLVRADRTFYAPWSLVEEGSTTR